MKGQPLIYVTNVGKKQDAQQEWNIFFHLRSHFFLITNNLWNKKNFTQQAILGNFGFLIIKGYHCRNPSLRIETKAKGLQGWRPRGKPGSHISCSRECRRVWRNELHTPKWAPTLEVEVMMNSPIFKEWLQGSKPIELKRSLYYWKTFGT
jgi:hypothetical protein